MEWFARHTSWLYRETKELSSNSTYKELHQAIDQTLISSGHIKIHKSKTEYFPILIVYPEATPYIPPTIYILENEITEEKTIEYSSLTPDDIRNNIMANIRFFNRRHQNEDGSICFVERGDLHDENPEIYPIESIIKRLRIWLSGKIPIDNAEVELFHHFPNRSHEIQYLLPDLFFDETIVKGKFYAGLTSLIPANSLPDDIIKKNYMGVVVFGENKKGVSIPPKTYDNDQLLLFTPIPDYNIIIGENKEGKLEKIQNGKLIEGFWWEIDTEPTPFSTVNELASYIGNGNFDKGLAEMVDNIETELSPAPYESINIGLRFPGRLRARDWQMFRLKRGSRTALVGGGKEELKQRLLDYSLQAVHQEYFTDDQFHMRNRGRAERGLLKNKSLSIIGCGALGSETADAVAKSGVGKIILVDKENMRAHNAVRHVLGIDRTNIPKSIGMGEHLVLHNPFINYRFKFSDILTAKLNEYFPQNTIGVSTIADDNVEAYLNEQALGHDRTVFYCRALRGGKVARIFRVIPQKDACKACLGLYLMDKDPLFYDIPEDSDLPAITNECNNPVRPASAADMKTIAGIFSRVIIDFLQNKGSDDNHWIWSSEPLEGLNFGNSMCGLFPGRIPPHPKCPVCKKLEKAQVYIEKRVLEFIRCECSESGSVETGGILIGYRKSGNEYIILQASKPGPKAVRTPTRFEKDEEYCQQKLLFSFQELGEGGLYLGEWHYHPSGGNKPSGLDVKSLTEIASQDNYRIDKPIMIILSKDLEFAITIHDKNGRCVQIPLNIFDENDKIQDDL